MSDLAECAGCGRRVVASALKRVGNRRVCPPCVPEATREEAEVLAEAKRLAHEAQAKGEKDRQQSATEKSERERIEREAAELAETTRKLKAELAAEQRQETAEGDVSPTGPILRAGKWVGLGILVLGIPGCLAGWFALGATMQLVGIVLVIGFGLVERHKWGQYQKRMDDEMTPACPHCGGQRSSEVRSNRDAVTLKWLGFFILLVSIGGCLVAMEAGIGLGVIGLILMLVGGGWESSSRKRWWICRACDTAEEAPRKASDL